MMNLSTEIKNRYITKTFSNIDYIENGKNKIFKLK